MWMKRIGVNACHLTFKICEKWQLLLPSNGHRNDWCKSWQLNKVSFSDFGWQEDSWDRQNLTKRNTYSTVNRKPFSGFALKSAHWLQDSAHATCWEPCSLLLCWCQQHLRQWHSSSKHSQHKVPWTVKFLLLSIHGAEKLILACCPWRTAGLLCPCEPRRCGNGNSAEIKGASLQSHSHMVEHCCCGFAPWSHPCSLSLGTEAAPVSVAQQTLNMQN